MPLDIFSGCTAQFVSDLVGKFSHNEAQIMTLTAAHCKFGAA